MAQTMAQQPSFELFTPRSAVGVEELLQPRGRLSVYAAYGPSFVSVSGPAGGGTLAVLEGVRKGHCLRTQLHLPRADLQADGVTALVDSAMRLGVTDALVLGGAPGSLRPASGGGFGSAAELVAFLKKRYGARLRVAVCGYPRGTCGEAGDYAADLAQLAKQVAAGAESVVCLPVFAAAVHTAYVADARGAGVDAPIVPGVLPLGAPAEFRRICRALHVTPPEDVERVLAAAEATPAAADETARAAGRTRFASLVGELRAAGACAPHVYTLNSTHTLDALAAAGFRPLKHRQP
jgi:methylenetetrahydrofolate reductase (NADPH)